MTKGEIQELITEWRATAKDLQTKAEHVKQQSTIHRLASIVMHQAHAQAYVYQICADQLEIMSEK